MIDLDNPSESFRNGWIAHSKGRGVHDNPYDEETESWSYLQWESGWCRRFSAIKHDQHTDQQDEAIESLY